MFSFLCHDFFRRARRDERAASVERPSASASASASTSCSVLFLEKLTRRLDSICSFGKRMAVRTWLAFPFAHAEPEDTQIPRSERKCSIVSARTGQAEKLRRERMPVGSESYFDDLTYVEVAQALAGLEPAQREVVAMSALGGMTSVEIAQALGIPAPTVRTRLRAARLRLRELKRHGDV